VSKPFGLKLRGLSTYEKEYVAILLAVDQLRPYLQLREFLIASNQKSLSYLNDQRLHTKWQQKVFTKLLGLQYKIVYKKGAENREADVLSRGPLPNGGSEFVNCFAISSCQPKWLSEILSSYDKESFVMEMMSKLMLDPAVAPNYTLIDGLLRYKSRIWIDDDAALQCKLISACHSSALGNILECR
jgi:hypothetical protein